MAARPQEAPPFSVPCSRRHFTLITMRLAPSSLPQPLESLTPSLGLPSLPFNPSHPGFSSHHQSYPSPSKALTYNRLGQRNPCSPVVVLKLCGPEDKNSMDRRLIYESSSGLSNRWTSRFSILFDDVSRERLSVSAESNVTFL